MASTQVINTQGSRTGAGTMYTYTNTTGKNVRVIISYCSLTPTAVSSTITLASESITYAQYSSTTTSGPLGSATFGKNVAGFIQNAASTTGIAYGYATGSNAIAPPLSPSFGQISSFFAGPTELYLAPGENLTVSVSAGSGSFKLNAMVVTES